MKHKKIGKVLLIILAVLLTILTVLSSVIYFGEKGKFMLPIKHKEAYSHKNIASFPQPLHIKENKILNSDNEIIELKGLMAADLSVLHYRNKFNKKLFKDMKEMGANVIRLPVHPHIFYKEEDYFWRYIDSAVTWAGELDMYLIIDWHYIGNIDDGTGDEMPNIDIHPKEFTMQFWKQAAQYFKDVSHVLFEIYNEPVFIKPEKWAGNAQEIVNLIRDEGAKQPIIVSGTTYSSNLSWVKENPINDDNIIYTAHIYPIHDDYDTRFGDVSDHYPVLITEWGFMDENRTEEQFYLAGNRTDYGEPFIQYLNEKNIGWVACWFDDRWGPAMFKEGFKEYTNYGQFIDDLFKGKIK